VLIDRWVLASRLAITDRRLLLDYARWYLTAWIGHRAEQTVHRAVSDAVTLGVARQAIEQVAGPWTDGPAVAQIRSWVPPKVGPGEEGARMTALMAGDQSLGELVYALVRATRPAVVVETGVAAGVTSAFALAAMADNRMGELHSIDLPPTAMINAGLVGGAVPTELRARWTYHWGASRRLLPEIFKTTRDRLALFVHDSDHRYAPMRWELESAWEVLPPGGWIVADDVDYNDAFADMAATTGVPPLYVRQASKVSITGLLHKVR
jgi:predicted O-methyltransferase YrrM